MRLFDKIERKFAFKKNTSKELDEFQRTFRLYLEAHEMTGKSGKVSFLRLTLMIIWIL